MIRWCKRLIPGMLLLILACSPYKELKPRPEIVSRESEYIELLNKDKFFRLKAGKKYFIKFPGINQPDFYLALRVSHLDQIYSYLTRQFTRGKAPMVAMPDESAPTDDLLVYRLDPTVPVFYWVIDTVRQDIELDMEYRYVPIWRFKFETRSHEFRVNLTRNQIDRQVYETLGVTLTAEGVDPARELQEVRQKSEFLRSIQGELEQIEAILPAGVRNTDDPAYLDFVDLQEDLQRELAFQEDYAALMTVLLKERQSRNNAEKFVEAIPDFARLFEQQDRYPGHVIQEVDRLLGNRLVDFVPQYEQLLRRKRDAAPIDFPVEAAESLISSLRTHPEEDVATLVTFIRAYNRPASAYQEARQTLQDIREEIRKSGNWPSGTFYRQLRQRVDRLLSTLPVPSRQDFGKYGSYACVSALERAYREIKSELSRFGEKFRRAQQVVSDINRYRRAGDYRAIARALSSNRDLDFLRDQYPNVDELSLKQYQVDISRAIQQQRWAEAERNLRTLHEDRNFMNYSAIARKKNRLVQMYEDSLASAVERASRTRAEAFIQANKGNFRNVEALYNDPALQPVYELTFSSIGPNAVRARMQKIRNALHTLTHVRFPELAIETLYRDFTRDIRDNGVEKALAIVAHGREYQGNNPRIRRLIAEIDPEVPKVLNKPRDYRRIYVIPTSATQSQSNQYLFRINLQIPSEAKFPVFDVNIKLPRELAKAATATRWYEQITINGKVLKNEGRFSIIAPTKENDYICQLTPLQVRKGQDNILEVRFTSPAYKVYEISVMAQRPIIRKN